jgi:HSP20 family protein
MDFRSLVPWREKAQAPAMREDFFDPFLTFRREVDRMFDDFFTGFRDLRSLAPLSQPITPVVDINENDKEIVVTAELPGLDEKDFEVTMSGDILTIQGEKKAEREQKNGNGYYMERRFGSFSRSVRLPYEVKDENIEARYEKGILTIRIPKPENIQKAVRHIEVKAQ